MEADIQAVATAAGGVLSLLLKYLPFVKDWFEKQSPGIKATVVAVLLVAGVFVFYFNGDLSSADALLAAVFGLVGSQATHTLTRKL